MSSGLKRSSTEGDMGGDIRTSEEQLFSRWPRRCEQFVRDGVVDPEAYVKAKPRILYLMKEPNDPPRPERKNWDLRQLLRETRTPWPMLALWNYGIMNSFPDWHAVGGLKHEVGFRPEWVRKCAVMNLKKSGGRGQSDELQIRKAAEENAKYLRRQIELIAPDLLICCRTAHHLREVLYSEELGTRAAWQMSGNGIYYANPATRPWVLIDYYHPQYRIPHAFLYTMLMLAVKEIRG